MGKIGVYIKAILCIIYGGISSFCIPTCLLIAFNLMHGPVNNPEGESFMLIGWFGLFAILILDIMIIVKIITSKSMIKHDKVIMLVLFIVAIIIASLMLDKNDWRLFLEYFMLKLEYH